MPPIPKREAELARPRHRAGGNPMPTTKGVMREVKIPAANAEWDKSCKMIWKSMKDSGQADFFQNSDWAMAYMLLDELNIYRKSARRSGQMLQTIVSGFEKLLLTEGDRRRVRLELEAPLPEQESASVLAIADYKQDLGVED